MPEWYGDEMCDEVNNNENCTFDGGDCEGTHSQIHNRSKNIIGLPTSLFIVKWKKLSSNSFWDFECVVHTLQMFRANL